MNRFLMFFMLTLIFSVVGCAVDINPGSGVISVSPRSNDFGLVNIGESVQTTFTVKNNSSNDINIASVEITGTNAADFDFLTDDFTVYPLTAGEQRDIIIAFIPISLGQLEATLVLTPDGEEKPVEVELTGEGQLGSEMVLVPEILDFENVMIGESAYLDLKLGNGTDFPVTIESIEIYGGNESDFEIIAGGADTEFDVPSKELHTISISFIPSEIGYREAYIKVTYGGGTGILESILTGNGMLTSSFDITPTYYNYGDVGINVSIDADFSITNTGNQDLVITEIKIVELDVPFAITIGGIDSLGTPVTISPGLSHEFTVTFTPTEVGPFLATFSVAHSSGDPFVGNLSGNGSDQVALSPNSHDFGSLNIGKTSNPFVFTVSNPTMSDVEITNISIGGADTTAFSANTPSSTIVAANGGKQEIEVTFSPSKDGPHSASLDLTIDGATPLFAQLMGLGASSPEFSITPPCGSTYNFGMIPFSSSKTADFTITNTGSGTLEVTSISIQNDTEGNFTKVSGGDPVSIETSPHVLKIMFSPLSVGPKSATLKIEYGTSSTCFITMTGEAATVNVTPTSYNFGNVEVGGSPEKKTFVVKNNTSDEIYVTSIVITGTDKSQFTSNPSGATTSFKLMPGETLNIEVTCTATAMGAISAVLEVGHNLDTETIKVPLTATGTGSPALKATPSSWDYGTLTLRMPQESKSKIFEIENVGTGTLQLSAISISGTNKAEFSILSGDNVPIELGPGQKHEIVVEFKPEHYGSKTAALTIAHNGVTPSTPYNIQLRGNAVGPDFVLVPDVITYSMGDARIGKTKRKGFYIRNAGNMTLSITSVTSTNSTDYKLEHTSSTQLNSIASGAMDYFYIDFIPQSAGNKSTTLRISHNSVGSPHEVTISGTGIGGSDEIDTDLESGEGGFQRSGNCWDYGTPGYTEPTSAHSGTKCFGTKMNSYYGSNCDGFILSPILDMSKSLSPKMSFYMWMYTFHYNSPLYYGCGWVELSVDGGTTWTDTLSPSPAYSESCTYKGAPKNVWGTGYSGVTYPYRQWAKVDIDLSAAAGKSQVQLVFYFFSGTATALDTYPNYRRPGWYIDDIKIYDSASPFPNNPCPQDNDITTKVTGSSYTLKWDCEGATKYNVYFGTTNPPTNKVGNGITAKQQTVSVAADRKYFWRVEAISGSDTYKSQIFYFETVSSHPRVLINELQTRTDSAWIEFYNPGTTPVYIGGYQCTIYSQGSSTPDGTFTIPMYYYLDPGGTIVFQDINSSESFAETVDFDFDWSSATHGIEVILQKHPSYPNTGVDYMRANTLVSHKPTDISWSGTCTSSNSTYRNWYRNKSADNDSYTDWTARLTSLDPNAKNPGQ